VLRRCSSLVRHVLHAEGLRWRDEQRGVRRRVVVFHALRRLRYLVSKQLTWVLLLVVDGFR